MDTSLTLLCPRFGERIRKWLFINYSAEVGFMWPVEVVEGWYPIGYVEATRGGGGGW